MLSTSARLVDPATGDELISYGWNTSAGILESLDFPMPSPRESKSNRSGTHGIVDSTRWVAERAITATISMPERPNTDTAVDNLAGLMNPQLRLWLYVQRPDWPAERRILVRGATFTCPPATLRKAQAGWVAPDALFEDADASTLIIQPSGTGTGGATFPLSFPLSFTAGVISGSAFVDVGGNAPAPFVIDMYGPCTDPMFRCIDTGEQVKFAGLTLLDGDFLRVDTGAQTAWLNGLSNQSRTQYFDFATSTWFALPAGRSSEVVFSPTSPTGNCSASLSWRSRYF